MVFLLISIFNIINCLYFYIYGDVLVGFRCCSTLIFSKSFPDFTIGVKYYTSGYKFGIYLLSLDYIYMAEVLFVILLVYLLILGNVAFPGIFSSIARRVYALHITFCKSFNRIRIYFCTYYDYLYNHNNQIGSDFIIIIWSVFIFYCLVAVTRIAQLDFSMCDFGLVDSYIKSLLGWLKYDHSYEYSMSEVNRYFYYSSLGRIDMYDLCPGISPARKITFSNTYIISESLKLFIKSICNNLYHFGEFSTFVNVNSFAVFSLFIVSFGEGCHIIPYDVSTDLVRFITYAVVMNIMYFTTVTIGKTISSSVVFCCNLIFN